VKKQVETLHQPNETLHETDVKQGVTPPDTDTDTEAEQKQQVQKPSEAPAGAREKSSKPGKPVDPRHQEFHLAFRAYFIHKNPSLPDEPWDGQEASHLARFLKKNPKFTTEQWKTVLTHRARSPVPHAASLSTWIGSALTWFDGPTDAYGKKTTGGNTHGSKFEQSQASSKRFLNELLGSPSDLDHESPAVGRTIEAGTDFRRLHPENIGELVAENPLGNW
jgi:hypothetical protein